MKKYAVIFALLISGILITLLEVRSIQSAREDQHLQTVVLTNAVEVGQELKLEDLTLQKVPQDLVPLRAYDDVSEVIGKTISIGMPGKTIITMDLLDENRYFMPSKGQSITAIRFNPEEVMCWEVNNGEAVEIIHIDTQGNLKALGNVIVKEFYDQNQSTELAIPTYMLVEGKSSVIEGIIRARGNGRLEAVKNN